MKSKYLIIVGAVLGIVGVALACWATSVPMSLLVAVAIAAFVVWVCFYALGWTMATRLPVDRADAVLLFVLVALSVALAGHFSVAGNVAFWFLVLGGAIAGNGAGITDHRGLEKLAER